MRRVAIGLAILANGMIGCGTVENLRNANASSGGSVPRIYGGVGAELPILTQPRPETSDAFMHAVLISLVCCDFPFTVIGDTLTLPYTVVTEVRRSLSDCYAPKAPAKLSDPS